jgi:hypothetical protein
MISVEWATEFLLFRFDGRRIGFFFFFFDFRRLNFCSFGFLNLMYVIRFFLFWVLYFWFDGFKFGDWVIAGPSLDVR